MCPRQDRIPTAVVLPHLSPSPKARDQPAFAAQESADPALFPTIPSQLPCPILSLPRMTKPPGNPGFFLEEGLYVLGRENKLSLLEVRGMSSRWTYFWKSFSVSLLRWANGDKSQGWHPSGKKSITVGAQGDSAVKKRGDWRPSPASDRALVLARRGNSFRGRKS